MNVYAQYRKRYRSCGVKQNVKCRRCDLNGMFVGIPIIKITKHSLFLYFKINVMKLRSFLLSFILLIPVLAMAQHHGSGGGYRHDNDYRDDDMSTLSIFSENGEQFFLVLNGINQNNQPTSKIRVEGLPQYGNEIEILFTDRRTPALRKKITISDPVDGRAVNMTLKLVRNRDGYPKLKFHKCTEVERNYRAPQDEYCMSYGQPRQVYNRDNTPPPPPAGPMPMDNRNFDDAKRTIANSSFDATRLSTAKTILSSNYLTTNQVMEICKLFSFEDTKLDFAEYAYSKTVDQNNYFKVGTIFHFDSNKQALNDFISGHR